MKGARLLLIVVVVLLVGGGFAACSQYNRFTTQDQAVQAQWGQVENQLQRRSDLIPNLVETVKGLAQQERDVVDSVTKARAQMMGARTPEDRMAAANAESSALARLLVVVENYPQIKSDQAFLRLQDSLENTENRLANERRRYNEMLQTYNTSLRRFPGNIAAGIFGFREYPYFAAPEEAKANPKVDFKR
jgi:LemA protein